VAPTLTGAGPRAFGDLPAPQDVQHVSLERLGRDVLLSGHLREP